MMWRLRGPRERDERGKAKSNRSSFVFQRGERVRRTDPLPTCYFARRDTGHRGRPRGVKAEAPKKCSTFPERSRHVLWDLWSTLIVTTPDFSSDLERAPGARSIAEEKSGVTILVIELHWSQGSEHFRSPAVFLGILPRVSLHARPHHGAWRRTQHTSTRAVKRSIN